MFFYCIRLQKQITMLGLSATTWRGLPAPRPPPPLKGNTFCSSLLSFQPSQSSFNPILSFSSEPVFIYPIFFPSFIFFSFILEENIEFSSQTIYIKYPTGNLKQREQFPFLSVSITFPEGIKPRKYLVKCKIL